MHTAKYANLRILQSANHFYNCRVLFDLSCNNKNTERKLFAIRREYSDSQVDLLFSQVMSLSENYNFCFLKWPWEEKNKFWFSPWNPYAQTMDDSYIILL